MNYWAGMLKSIYRKEPIISFVITAGVVNVAIGGLSQHWSLMGTGLGTVGVAIGLGLRQRRTRTIKPQHRPLAYVLPPSSPSLPMLSIAKKNPRQD